MLTVLPSWLIRLGSHVLGAQSSMGLWVGKAAKSPHGNWPWASTARKTPVRVSGLKGKLGLSPPTF